MTNAAEDKRPSEWVSIGNEMKSYMLRRMCRNVRELIITLRRWQIENQTNMTK